jgi:hypothetical protein
LSASQPRRAAKRQTWLSAIRTIRAVVGASTRSFASDQAATRSMVSWRSLQAPIGGASGSALASMWGRTIREPRQ